MGFKLSEEWGVPNLIGDGRVLVNREERDRAQILAGVISEGAKVTRTYAHTRLSLVEKIQQLTSNDLFILFVTPLVLDRAEGTTWEIVYCTREGKLAEIG